MHDTTPHRLGVWTDTDLEPPVGSPGRPDWTLIRAAYDAGESAPVLAARHRVSVSAIRTKARLQRWRRSDAPLVGSELVDPDLLEARPALELADTAWKRMSDAVQAGRLVEAMGWFRMHRELRDEARTLGVALRSDAAERDRPAYRPPVLDPAAHPGAPDVHGLHGLHAGVHVHDGSRQVSPGAI